MKLLEALQVIQKKPPAGAETRHVFLVCGFTPGHLEKFLTAELQLAYPDHHIKLETGLYGDAPGSLEQLRGRRLRAAAVVLEWPDLDPRLGLRHLGGWGPREAADILATVRGRAELYRAAIVTAAQTAPVAVCLPTLPLPPVGHTSGVHASAFECRLRESVLSLGAQLAEHASVRLVNPQRLDQLSPWDERRDVQSELLFGFPYKPAHASVIAELLCQLLKPPAPKKGLITDLDDTLWSGLVGEVGSEGISWDLDRRSQLHGLYQQMLRALADMGVLIAVASKNEPARVAEAFTRTDLLLPRERVFPLEVHWRPKSESVARILRAWNIAADSVVFIDDSPMEIAEVQAAHPGIEGILFPKRDYAAAFAMLERLRDLFGKPVITEEDSIRLQSLRAMADGGWRMADSAPAIEAHRFLEQADAEIVLDFDGQDDARAFELVNKTNQFNLNGRRFSEGDWRAYLDDPARFMAVVSYRDKFGPLGKIAVVAGHFEGEPSRVSGRVDAQPGRLRGSARRILRVDCWVMSCRAFARQIEHRCLEQLFERFEADAIVFDYRPTPKNGPLQAFFAEILGRAPEPGCRLTRTDFKARCPSLFHRVMELTHA